MIHIGEFIRTVFLLVRSGRFADLAAYFALIRELIALNDRTVRIIDGQVEDKPL